MKKVLLTGATGLVGQKLGQKLVQAGHEVFITTRNKKRAQQQLSFPAEMIEWDLKQPKMDLPEVDIVVHLAGEPIAQTWTAAVKKRLYDSRIDGTRSIVDSISQWKNNAKLISASAIGFYGDTGDDWKDESATAGDTYLAELCRDWEAEALKYENSHVVRIGIVLDRQQGALAKMKTPFELKVGAALGNGRQFMSWIHVDDLVQIFMDLVEERAQWKIVNGVADTLSNLDFSKVLAQHLGSPMWPNVPSVMIRMMVGEMAAVVLQGQRLKSQHDDRNLRFRNLKDALNDLLPNGSSGSKTVVFEQYLPEPKEKAFRFFSDISNLEKITPAFLNFRILGMDTKDVQSGSLIDYKLRLFGVPFRWRTEIADWQPPTFFSDKQLKGPYSVWYHQHEFENLGSGVLMRDRIQYKPPMGFLGRFVAGWWVDRQVQEIFKHRKKVLSDKYYS